MGNEEFYGVALLTIHYAPFLVQWSIALQYAQNICQNRTCVVADFRAVN